MRIFNHGLPIPRKKVESGGVDTSADTVTPSTLVKDYTAHDAEGKPIVGELDLEVVKGEGYTEGHADGYAEGHEVGEAEGFEDGKIAENNAINNLFYLAGNATNEGFLRQGMNAFSGGLWNNDTVSLVLRGRHFTPANCSQMFLANRMTGDFDALLKAIDSQIDFSQASNLSSCFSSSKIEKLPTLNCSSATNFTYAFMHATLMIEVTFVEGCIKANIDFGYCPLNKASIVSVLGGLDLGKSGLTLTLRLDAVNKAFETSEGAMDGSTSDEWLALAATKANWTISLINS